MINLTGFMLNVDGSLHLENMNFGLLTTVLGIVMVFLILVVICLLLVIFSAIVNGNKQTEKVTETPKAAPILNDITVKAAPEPAVQYTDDKELVAVITAAIAATMGTGTDGLIVRRIRRVGNWNQDAIEQQQQNSLF